MQWKLWKEVNVTGECHENDHEQEIVSLQTKDIPR